MPLTSRVRPSSNGIGSRSCSESACSHAARAASRSPSSAARWARQRAAVASAHGRPSDFPCFSSCRVNDRARSISPRAASASISSGRNFTTPGSPRPATAVALGEAAQVRVRGLGVVERQCDEPEHGDHHGPDRNVPGPVAQGERLAREFCAPPAPGPGARGRGQGVQRGGSHGLLVALVGHPAASSAYSSAASQFPAQHSSSLKWYSRNGSDASSPRSSACRYRSASLSRASSSRSHHFQDHSRDQGLDRASAGARPAPRPLTRRAPRPCRAGPAGRRCPGGTRRRRPGRASAPPGPGRLLARPSEAMPSPSGRRPGRSPATSRANASSCSACAHRAGSSRASSAAWRNVCSASGQPLWW